METFESPLTGTAGSAVRDNPVLRAMISEVAQSAALYRPSRFWTDLNEINEAMLEEVGLENFKRTLAQNYFNWLVTSRKDAQYRSVRKLWLRRPSLQPYLNKLETPALLQTLQPYLNRLSNSSLLGASMGPELKLGAAQLRVYKLFVGMLWEYAIQQDWSGIAARTVEPLAGNPITLLRRGQLISQDLANSIREYNSILSHDRSLARLPKRVAELGAGYGRLGHVFLSDQATKYYIFDIPPALFVAQWYLGAAHPARKIFEFRHIDKLSDVTDELEAADAAFFTPNQLELFPEGFFDIFVSISTLPEMASDQVANYLVQAQRVAGRYVYLKQWLDWENQPDGHRVTRDSIRLGEGWEGVLDRRDSVQPGFFERLWQRTNRVAL